MEAKKNMEVLCKESFLEDSEEYWSEGCYYEVVGIDGNDYSIRTNFNGVGRIYAEDFDEYFEDV